MAALVIAGAVALAIPATAASQAPGDRQIYEAELTNQAPGSSTGLRQRITYVNPTDPNGKPHAVAEIVFSLPEGTRIDTTAPAQCGASEVEFQLQGAAACPPESRVGSGALTADTGLALGAFPRVIETVVTFFNNQDELILFAESTNTPGPPIRVASRIQVRGTTFSSSVPPIPGAPPPDPFLAVKDVFNELDPITVSRQGRSAAYITTPDTCPASGQWTITAAFTYRDGVTQNEEVQTPCARAADETQDRRPGNGRPGRRGQGNSEQGQGGTNSQDGTGRRGDTGGGGHATMPVGGVDAGMGGSAANFLLAAPGPLRFP